MRLTPDEQALLPTDEDVAFYREHGWYISKKILPDDLIAEAIVGSERHFSGDRDATLPISDGFMDWKQGDGDGVRNCEYVTLQNRQIRKLIEYPLLGATAARLAGSRQIRLFDDQLIFKPPSTNGTSSVVGWHTDRAYWMTCTSTKMLTAWIPFHDCPAEMGPLLVIDRSHKWADTSSTRTFNNKDLGELEQKLSAEHGSVKKVPIILQRGQVSFHNCLSIHASDVNRSQSRRLSLALHMQDDDNRYRQYLNDKGVLWQIANDRICRQTSDGMPDYTDPQVFPVLWSDDCE
jgi:hypothetical protein